MKKRRIYADPALFENGAAFFEAALLLHL